MLWRFWIITNGGGHEAVAVEGHVVVGILGHLRLFISHAAQGAGGAGVLLAATLSLHCQDSVRGKRDAPLCQIQSYDQMQHLHHTNHGRLI